MRDAQEENNTAMQFTQKEKKQTLDGSEIPQRKPLPQILRKKNIKEYSRFELRSLAEWAMSDGLLRTDDELMRDMCKALGFKKLGPNIRKAFEQALRDLRSRQKFTEKRQI